jgi:hypothetical protein
MSNKMTPYFLIIPGAVLLLSGLGLLIRQRATAAREVPAPVPVPAKQPASESGQGPAPAGAASATTNAAGETTSLPKLSAAAERPAAPSNYEKGLDFEKWAVDHINPAYWKLEEWQGDKYHNGQYPESNRNPDLVYKVHVGSSVQRIALECKWRKAFVADELQWASPEQIALYKRFQDVRAARVFVVIGVGGIPAAPFNVYVVPLEALKKPAVTRQELQQYRSKNKAGKFYYDFGREALALGRDS